MSEVRRWLAAQTSPLHHAVDASAASLDLSTADSIVCFMARGFGTVEPALDRAGAGRVLPEWPARRRAHLTGVASPAADDAVEFGSDPEVWGGLYVLEGSRLGGTMLARQHAALAQHPFFAAAETFWPTFVRRLDEADAALEDRDGMLAGARKAFGAFLHSS